MQSIIISALILKERDGHHVNLGMTMLDVLFLFISLRALENSSWRSEPDFLSSLSKKNG